MNGPEFGYMDNPANGLGIIRARTLVGNFRLWDMPCGQEALDVITDEVGCSPIPGLYLLFDERGARKVYIGQTGSLKDRLLKHIQNPETKIKNWQRAIVINDARNSTHSDLNDENIRLVLENYLTRLFKINRYTVTTVSSRQPTLSTTQNTLVQSFKKELNLLLTRKNKINKTLTERGDDEVYNDEVLQRLKEKGHGIDKWGKVNAVVDGEHTFLRAGSEKPNGWQVTFRGNKPDSFKSSLEKGEGYLLMPRGPILLIPLSELKLFVEENDEEAFQRDTMDVFVKFYDEKIVIVYKRAEKDITQYTVMPFKKSDN